MHMPTAVVPSMANAGVANARAMALPIATDTTGKNVVRRTAENIAILFKLNLKLDIRTHWNIREHSFVEIQELCLSLLSRNSLFGVPTLREYTPVCLDPFLFATTVILMISAVFQYEWIGKSI